MRYNDTNKIFFGEKNEILKDKLKKIANIFVNSFFDIKCFFSNGSDKEKCELC